MNAINDNAPQDSSQDLAMTPDMYNRVCRNADIERWRSQDSVLGYKIKRPSDCDCDCEICKIGEGIYPLEFEWSGWHDGCRCYVTPIMLDISIRAKCQDILLSGGDPEKFIEEQSKQNKILEMPLALFSKVIRESHNEDFLNQDWVKNNLNLIMASGKRQYESFKFEYPNRVRIFEDCNRLIQTTVNFEIFQRRAAEALNFIKWIYEKKAAGMPIKLNMSESEAVDDFCRVFNKHCARIAREIAAAADTPRKAKNALAKLETIKSTLKESDNKSECESEINTLIFNLNIDANGK